ncbi:MAG: NAD(P)/FAD-dependent oxidoreductase [Candidatus Obscuribacterales bacterium]|nr:NAD(P)/FAD-dependent oxidoreductase [Candidatus Obscuribacterales bacterium]
MNQRIAVIGAGINGLVAANYLQKAGNAVYLLEKKANVGGACTFDTLEKDGKIYEYPSAATVLGFMQDFVFEETGLAARLEIREPEHPALVWFEDSEQPCILFDDIEKLKIEIKTKWNENGNVEGFYSDFERVRQFLIKGYREAKVPTIEQAELELGVDTTNLWISGSAKKLMDHYFSSEEMKIFWSIEVTESGPVPLDSPYSAFTIPLLASGSIFDGEWGFVKGGLWKLTECLAEINKEIGVKIFCDTQIESLSPVDCTVTYVVDNKRETLKCDQIIFATDPHTAAALVGDDELISTVSAKQALGSSAKLIMLFKNPIKWQNDTELKDFDSAFKFIITAKSLKEIESNSQSVIDGKIEYKASYFELYCEGAGLRSLNADRGYDALTVFFKNMALSKKGIDLPNIKEAVEKTILSRIINKEDLIESILLTPQDLKEKFFFPQGNIDHIEIQNGQTFFARSFSSDPQNNFYQFGKHKNLTYCAAGTYPCGSIAGTAGYMCAKQVIRNNNNNNNNNT